MTKVLARVPGYGGLNICDVVGENDSHYSLRYTSYDLQRPMDYVMSYPPDDAPREWISRVFMRRKSKCYPYDDRFDQ